MTGSGLNPKIQAAIIAMNALESTGDFAIALSHISDGCFLGAQECESAWQDPGAGRLWKIAGKRLAALSDTLARQWGRA